MADSTGLQFTLTLPGADDTAVVRFTHREALSEPFALSVEFASRTHDLSPSDCLDQNATLTIWQDGEPLRRVHGIISELHRGDRGHRRSFYRVEIRPALWRLSLRHNSRIFQDTSPFDAITTLANERSLTDIGFATTRTPLDREFLVQYRETDLAFIERLAAEEGCFYFHEFENAEGGKHQLVFADATVVLPSVGERTYHSRAGGTPPRRHLRKLRQVNRVRPALAMLKDYTFKNPRYSQLHEYQARDLEEHAQREDYEHFDYPGRYKKDASGKPFTRHRLESLRADASTAEAESDLPELAPGICFTLTDHDIDSLNCRWQVVSVVHHGEQPQALEEDGMARGNNGSSVQPGEQMTRYYNELLIMPRDQTFRPVPNPKPRVDGPQVAFVVGPEGEEIYCDENGRVKVQFPWDRYAEPNETASCWVRVAQGWAGGGYGSMEIPRIGHEVIITHLEGDPDQPLITGRTYHASNTPPYPLPANKTRTVIRTQSHKSKGFNELRFEDATDKEQIWLHAQKDLELLTLNDRTEEIKRDSHLKIHRHRQTEIDNDDHHTVHRHRFEHIEGTQHLNVEGTMHMRAGQAWLSESGQELHIKSGQQAVLEADGEITLKVGGSFIKLDAGGITIVGPQVKINAGGSPGSGTGQAAEKPRLPGEAVPEVSEDATLMAHQLSSEVAGAAALPVALLVTPLPKTPLPQTPTTTVTRIAVGTAANDAVYATKRSLLARIASIASTPLTFVTGMLYSPALGGELERIEAPDGTVYRKYLSERIYTATGQDGSTWQTASPQDDIEYRTWLANGGAGSFEDWVSEGKPEASISRSLSEAEYLIGRSPWTQISSDARSVVKDIENATGLAIPPFQRENLADQLREVDHRIPVSGTTYANLQREYRRNRTRMMSDWEANTGQSWPDGAQLHHIIPQRYGGPNQWWNAHPAFPGQHQGGIHRRDSPTQSVFPTPVPRQ